MPRAAPLRRKPPSGRQVELTHGHQRAVVVEVGGGLREYEVDGQPVLDGYPVERMADGGRGQPLLPWPNRLADGLYEFEGEQLQLPIDEVGRHNASHGLTRWINWRVIRHAANNQVVMGVTVHPRPGYPFTLDLRIEYSLTDAGLAVRTQARNSGPKALPFGTGQHPYFTVGTPLVDAATLHIPAEHRLELDRERLLPTGVLFPVEDSEYDFKTPRQIGSLVLDDCFSGLGRNRRDHARVELVDTRTRATVGVWMDNHYRYVQVFSGDTLAPERRRRGVAIEPMTCPPNAFRTGTDLIVLQPDEMVSLEWGVERFTGS